MKTRLESNLFDYSSHYTEDDVLVNKLGITNKDLLEEAERKITTFKLSKLHLYPSKVFMQSVKDEEAYQIKEASRKTFDMEHYMSIHKYLFGDIYPFAGEIRDEEITKSYSFCLPQYIYEQLDKTLNHAGRYVKELDSIDKLIEYVTLLFARLDFIHPFREGNGRCEREYIRQYINYVCEVNNLGSYEIDYSLVDRKEFIDAVRLSARREYEPLKDVFTKMIVSETKTR